MFKYLQETCPAELERRNIDRYGDLTIVLLVPCSNIYAGFFQNPLAYTDNLPCSFCKRNENRRRNITLLRVLPANQSFYASHLTICRINNRLIEKIKLFLVDRLHQFHTQICIIYFWCRFHIGFFIPLPDISALSFGFLHRQNRLINQLRRMLNRTVICNNTNTGTQVDLVFIHDKKLGQQLQHFFSNSLDLTLRILT